MDEISLAHAAQNGDLDAFNRLVLVHQGLAYNVAYRILGDPHAADDATQDAFIAAYKNLKRYRGGSFRAWLMRIVTNKCYDELRRQKRRPQTPLEPVNPDTNEEIESPEWIQDDSPSPEDQTETMALEEAIQDCIQQLPDDFRVVVVMVDVQDLDYDEASQAIGKPLGTIKSRLYRARTRLKDCLQGYRELLPAVFRLDNEELS